MRFENYIWLLFGQLRLVIVKVFDLYIILNLLLIGSTNVGKILESENLRKSSAHESDDIERALLGNVLSDVLADIIRYFLFTNLLDKLNSLEV